LFQQTLFSNKTIEQNNLTGWMHAHPQRVTHAGNWTQLPVNVEA
jgi:hypothetical protein